MTTMTASPTIPSSTRVINKSVLVGLIALHAGALLAPLTFSWTAFWIFAVLLWLTNGLGICMGFHRLLTHKSFKCPKWFEYFLAVCGTMTSQGGALSWVATHRYHHTESDTINDPHSPHDGVLWSHMIWFVYAKPYLNDQEFMKKYAPELYRDPVHHFLEYRGWIFQWILGAALFIWGGLPYVIWGIFLRTVVALHLTWFVNSVTHKWGYKNFKTTDDSRNLWWVGLLAFGEGWHNNHHAFQQSAAHGLKWWEFDLTYETIKFLSLIGIAKEVKLPSARLMEELAIKK